MMMNGVAPPGDNNRWTLSPRPKPAASQIVFSSKTNAFGRKIQGWPQPQVARRQSHPPQSPSGSLSHKTLRKDKRSWTFQECGFRWKLQVKGLLKWAHSHSQQFKILRAQSSFRHWWLSGISIHSVPTLCSSRLHDCHADSTVLDKAFHEKMRFHNFREGVS